MAIYDKKLTQIKPNLDPSIGVTRWSIASNVQLVAHQGPVSTLITLSPNLATRLGWALLEAAGAKNGDDPA